MKNQDQLFILTGPSGVGKTTVAHEVLAKMPKLKRLVTYTTREPRPNEQGGIDYNFITREKFLKKKANNELFEWAEVYGNFYGNSIADLKQIWNDNKIALMVIDVQGARTIKKIFANAPVIFVLPDSMENLAKRIRQRPMSDAAFEKRWAAVQKELEFAEKCEFKPTNYEGKLDDTAMEVMTFIKKTS